MTNALVKRPNSDSRSRRLSGSTHNRERILSYATAPSDWRAGKSSDSPPRRRTICSLASRWPITRPTPRRRLERVSGHDAALTPIAETLSTARYLVADAATDLASYLTNNEADGTQELDTVQNRRAELSAVIRRYGTLDEVLAFRDVGGGRLLELDSDDDRIA